MKFVNKTIGLLAAAGLTASCFALAEKTELIESSWSRYDPPRYDYFGLNDNEQYFLRVLFWYGRIDIHLSSTGNGATFSNVNYLNCQSFNYPHTFVVTNDNILISFDGYSHNQGLGYISTYNIATNECLFMDIGAVYRVKDYNASAVVLYESDGILLRYTPQTAVNEVIPTPQLGITHAKLNDAGYIAYSIDSSVSYFTHPESSTPFSIPKITRIRDLNNNNIVVGSSDDACYIYNIDNAELTQIDEQACSTDYVRVNDNNIVLVEKPDSAAWIYRIESDEKFNVLDLYNFGGGFSKINYFTNLNKLFFSDSTGYYNSYSIVPLTLPPIPPKTYTLDNSDASFKTSSRWAVFNLGKLSSIVPLADDEWSSSQRKTPIYGDDFIRITSGTGTQTVSWSQKVELGATYDVLVRYPKGYDNNSQARYIVKTPYESTEVVVNQLLNAGEWVSLGRFYVDDSDVITVELSDKGDGETVADVVRLQPD